MAQSQTAATEAPTQTETAARRDPWADATYRPSDADYLLMYRLRHETDVGNVHFNGRTGSVLVRCNDSVDTDLFRILPDFDHEVQSGRELVSDYRVTLVIR